MYLETNMQIIRNNRDTIITITANYIRNKNPEYDFDLTNLTAYDNNGKEIFLSLSEENEAKSLLLREILPSK